VSARPSPPPEPSSQDVARLDREWFLARYEATCGHAVDELREEGGVLVCEACGEPLRRRA